MSFHWVFHPSVNEAALGAMIRGEATSSLEQEMVNALKAG